MYLLFPGRHLVHTTFQEHYLRKVLKMQKIQKIIFAVTSSNQENSRYNPTPFYTRAIGVDRFARQFKIPYTIVGIPHYPPTPKFAENTLKEIIEETKEELTQKNTIVLCSTPELIVQYRKLGFRILPAELNLENGTYQAETPISLVKMVAAFGKKWKESEAIKKGLSKVTLGLWKDFPSVPERIVRIYRDPLLNEAGGLTKERSYDIYAFRMGNSAMIKVKYLDIRDFITPGKIVDEGCADGALLVLIAKDFPDSDLIGIDLAAEFLARCKERQRAEDFSGSYIHFHQRNLLEPIFEKESIDTTICNSTGHEIWSYGRQEKTISAYLKMKYQQTRKGGRLILRDVVGPEQKENKVYMLCNEKDGSNKDVFKICKDAKELAEHLKGLSTKAKFLRFAEDFLAGMRSTKRRNKATKIQWQEEKMQGESYIALCLKDAAEFMSKYTYVENWDSEMNEEFAFWSFSEWKGAVQKEGFRILENPNNPGKGSRTYTSSWIVKNRYKGKIKLFHKTEKGLWEMGYPVTNMVLIAEK